MTIHIALAPLLAIVAGVAILVIPKSFRFIVAAYLIAIGVLGLIR